MKMSQKKSMLQKSEQIQPIVRRIPLTYNQKSIEIREHQDWVLTVAISKNLSLIATGGVDREVKIFDMNDFSLLTILTGHLWEINFLKFYNNEYKLISQGADNVLFFWDMLTYQLIQKIDTQSVTISSMDIHQNDKFLIVGKNNQVQIWDLEEYSLVKELDSHHDAVQNVLLSHDSNFIYSTANDHTLKIWDFNKQTLKSSVESDHNSGYLPGLMALTSDDKILALAGPENSVTFYNAKILLVTKVIPDLHLSMVRSVLFSSNGQYLISGDKGGLIKLVDLKNYENQDLKGHKSVIFQMQLFQDDKFLVSASADDTIRIWELMD